MIGAGLDLGAGRRGVDMGPSAIRYAGLQERIARLGRECVDWGDVDVSLPEATEANDAAAARLATRRGEVAQLVEHTAENRGVAGSSPALAIGRGGSTFGAGEHLRFSPAGPLPDTLRDVASAAS